MRAVGKEYDVRRIRRMLSAFGAALSRARQSRRGLRASAIAFRPAEGQQGPEQAPVRSPAARMFAVRQLQMAAPSMGTVSMPPMTLVSIPTAEFGSVYPDR